MSFKELGVTEAILRALKEEGYTHPTPIQVQAIPILLKGKDLLACAQTGTGKTAAFAVPILQNLLERAGRKSTRKIKALVVTPTRELAIQIGESFSTYGKYTGIINTVIFGGVKQGKQVKTLSRGVDVLVATPGRLLDLINQGFISLRDIEYFTLDEADHMLDMGFIHDIRKIVAMLPKNRQSLFFSATMPPAIVNLSGKILGNPEKVSVAPKQATAELVEQAVYFVKKSDKPKLLIHILQTENADTTLVFSRTKHGSDKIVKLLNRAGINAAAIHGNKSQNARQKALESFKSGKLHVLVATDIAARGIDVEELSLVINFNLPNVPETYVHRIGRTGRAKASGIALSFCDMEERSLLRDIERLINQRIPIIKEQPFVDDEKHVPVKSKPQSRGPRRTPSRSGGARRNGSGPQSSDRRGSGARVKNTGPGAGAGQNRRRSTWRGKKK